MAVIEAAGPILITPMPQLAEAVDKEDDWTGITDAAARRKRQTRLNTRAWRRRKALEAKLNSISGSKSKTGLIKSEPEIPCWDDEAQTIVKFPASVAYAFYKVGQPLIDPHTKTARPYDLPVARCILPLSSDHLITLLQLNVLRGFIANRYLLTGVETSAMECYSEELKVFKCDFLPGTVPPSLEPTLLQRTVPHGTWIDLMPHPIWRDNLILEEGNFDEDDLWCDVIGGLYEGCPDSNATQKGIVAWNPPWDSNGWELSEEFMKKWAWALKGCGDMLEATNRWREKRGEMPIVFEL